MYSGKYTATSVPVWSVWLNTFWSTAATSVNSLYGFSCFSTLLTVIFEKSPLAGQLQSLDGVTVVPFTDLDWLGDMKEGVAIDFFEIKSNLHINFNSTQPFVLQRIAQRANADMVIGMQNQVNIPFNFIVAGKDGEVLSNIEYLNQIFHYLKIINKDVKDVE